MADVAVRPASITDAPAIAAVQVGTWRTAYGHIVPAAVLDRLSEEDAAVRWRAAASEPPSPRHHLLAAVERERLVGFAASGPAGDDAPDPATGEIYALLVQPESERAGHGSRLLAATVEHLRADGFRTAVIWLFDADAGTQAFYESAGWALDGGRRELDMGVRIPEVRLHTDIT